MSGILLACALGGSKHSQRAKPSGHMYIVIQYVDENGAGVVASRHDEVDRLLDLIPKAKAWVNVRADSYADAMAKALKKGF